LASLVRSTAATKSAGQIRSRVAQMRPRTPLVRLFDFLLRAAVDRIGASDEVIEQDAEAIDVGGVVSVRPSMSSIQMPTRPSMTSAPYAETTLIRRGDYAAARAERARTRLTGSDSWQPATGDEPANVGFAGLPRIVHR
jgi:hypothetical protein